VVGVEPEDVAADDLDEPVYSGPFPLPPMQS